MRPTAPTVFLLLVAGCGKGREPAAAAGSPAAPAWLTVRQAAQHAAGDTVAVLHDFTFVDRSDSSGITFVNRIVDDAGRDYKKVHYDHGNGLAAADVDGDGRPDLYFVSQLGTSELWRNLGGGRFENITVAAGLALPDAIAVGASFADIDNDGDPDLFVTTVRHGNRLFENTGSGKFVDITAAAGVGYVGHSSGAVFFDYDNDGRLDLFVANVGAYTAQWQGAGGYYVGLPDAFEGHLHPERTEPSILYRNLGGNHFQDVTKQTGLIDTGWSGDATPIDVNGDGRLDLYVLNMQGDNHLWLNEGGTRFRESTRKWFPRTPWGAMGAKVFDADGDGHADLFVTDMHSDMFTNIAAEDVGGEARKSDSAAMPPAFFPGGKGRAIFGNALFLERNGKYQEQSDAFGVENYWPWGPSVDDLNADGWDDIVIASSMNFPFRYAVNSVLLNQAGKRFLPSEFLLGVEPRPDGATEKTWFTLDCAGADRGHPFCMACAQPGASLAPCRQKDPQGRLPVMGALGSRAAILVDLDGDGDLDLVTNEFNDRPRTLLSNLGARHPPHWLQVRLDGKTLNREGLGSRVTVILPDGQRLLKVLDGKSGYLSQSDLPLYFGLGAADAAASVEVIWPGGKLQRLPGPLPSGRTLTIAEP